MTMRPAYDMGATQAALERIAENGADLARPLCIDFFVSVPDARAGQVVATRAASFGFLAKVERDPESGAWTCYCTKTLIPTLSEVAAIERQLDGFAQDVGGYTDGFGSFGNV